MSSPDPDTGTGYWTDTSIREGWADYSEQVYAYSTGGLQAVSPDWLTTPAGEKFLAELQAIEAASAGEDLGRRGGGLVNRDRDRDALAPWRSARTLADLGELTAQWLDGMIGSQPGYAEGCGPDDETRPLVGVLAAANRAGYIIVASQPGESGFGDDGAWWSQRAAVSGFADDAALAWLRAEGWRASLIVIAHRPRRWRTIRDQAMNVTRRANQEVTWFGSCRSQLHLRDWWTGYGECHPDAVAALCQAWQVTLVDPQWGRDSLLWPVLQAFAGGEPQ